MFHYNSTTVHGILTPDGEKIKETNISVKNGKGQKSVLVKDNNKVYSHTQSLKKSEIKNIEKHIFMPKLFSKSLKHIKTRKAKASKKTTKKREKK